MRIIIAGGGIGGLTTALSLHAAGFDDVLVVEAARTIQPLGVGINLLPHAVRELTELGLADRVTRLGVPTGELAYFNRHGQLIWSEPRGLGAGYRWPQYSVHRGRLQLALLDAVRERLGPDAVRTGSRLTGFAATPDEVVVELGAERLTADLLIAADGIRSAVRARLYPAESAPLWNGLVLWRGVTRGKPFRGGRSMIMAGDHEQKFVAYPISEPDHNGDVKINWVAERPVDGSAAARGDWNRLVDVDEFLPHFAEWQFDWLDVPATIRDADVAYEYPMVDRDPLPKWTHGRVTLLGDAAHPMYPIGSNGASQAVLDARVLSDALARLGDPVRACEAYEAERRPPTAATQLANREMGPELVIKLAHERAPHGFADIEQVLPLAERAEIAARYKRTAGFDPEMLNERASYNATVGGPRG
ncbi:flavin-dependent oxidoreductase [Saccharothrix coeruleofusca]|uniref:Flavin-dependent oxidoreductase n=1 Tax=Saccharothrix coeruleofusca TaxID=33919 RepID=A0A918ASK6_9PSEU|nr:flavin-dependent oxidoreductase [Saccharothrix coeruleofusca]GGP65385.1 flavin-dependent oxidoreductase [Saccharothrix coeruleofusca]